MSSERKDFELSTEVVDSSKYRVTEDEVEKQIDLASTFEQKLYNLEKSFKGILIDNNKDVRLLLAMNKLMNREYSQRNGMSLESLKEVTRRFTSPMLFINNNYIISEDDSAGEQAVYVFIDPSANEEAKEILSHSYSQQIHNTTQEYDETNIPYDLFIYINTDSYDEHKSIEEDLANIITRPYHVLTHVPMNTDLVQQADFVVTEKPECTLTDIISSFITVFGLFRQRKHKVYFDLKDVGTGYSNYQTKYYEDTDGIGHIDFLLIAQRSLPNIVLDYGESENMARKATEYWLSPTENAFKFVYEEIRDFYHCPSLVKVYGLSPFMGFISDRKVEIRGVVIAPNPEDEKTLGENFMVKSFNSLSPFLREDEEELRTYLTWNPANLRSRLLKLKDASGNVVVIRVERLIKTLEVMGRNEARQKNDFAKYELTDFRNLIFLTPYFLGDWYNKLLQIKLNKPLNPYCLPDSIGNYLLRKASRRGYKKEIGNDADLKWFKPSTSKLEKFLTEANKVCNIESLLERGISPITGIDKNEIIVRWEDLKCLTKEK